MKLERYKVTPKIKPVVESSQLLKDIQYGQLPKLTPNEVATYAWQYPSHLFERGQICNISNLDEAGISSYNTYMYEDCLLRARTTKTGSTMLRGLPMSIIGDRQTEIELTYHLLQNQVYIDNIPQFTYEQFFGKELKSFETNFKKLIKLESIPSFFYKSPENLDYSGGNKKSFRKLLNNSLYTDLTVEYITYETLQDKHLFEISRMTSAWEYYYKDLQKSRKADPFISSDLANVYQKCRSISLKNAWVLIFIRTANGTPIIYSMTERINPCYVQLTLGKNNLELKNEYPDIARYIYMLETKYWSSLPDMDTSIWYNGGDVGKVTRVKGEDNKLITDWDYNKPDSYIYKEPLALHKRTLKPHLICPVVNLGSNSWLKQAKAEFKANKETKGIF